MPFVILRIAIYYFLFLWRVGMTGEKKISQTFPDIWQIFELHYVVQQENLIMYRCPLKC